MELIEVILSKENLNRAYQKVVANKGAGGIDGITVEELGDYIRENNTLLIQNMNIIKTSREILNLMSVRLL